MLRLPVSPRLAISASVLSLALSACASHPSRDSYVVFFEQESVTLNKAAKAIVKKAAQAAMDEHAQRIEVSGSSGRMGDPYVLRELATARAQVVAKLLVADGIDSGRIVSTLHSPRQDESSKVAQRRVSITINPR